MTKALSAFAVVGFLFGSYLLMNSFSTPGIIVSSNEASRVIGAFCAGQGAGDSFPCSEICGRANVPNLVSGSTKTNPAQACKDDGQCTDVFTLSGTGCSG